MGTREPEYAALDGYVVRMATPGAIGIAKHQEGLVNGGQRIWWIPRSLCEGGAHLEEGDTDIVVALWKAEQEGLDY